MATLSINLAGIDIGSNAARLLIKTVTIEDGHIVRADKQLFLRVPLRLGDDVFATGRVGRKRASNLLSLIRAYQQLMKIYDVADYRATASSALRDAEGGAELIRQIDNLTGINISIITGREEAALIYESHSADSEPCPSHNYLYVDVGGGSTEINLICRGTMQSSESYNIGTLRTLHGRVSDEERARLMADLAGIVDNAPMHIVGTGGNINKLYRLMGKPKSRLRAMTILELEQLAISLERLPEQQRRDQYGLKADRADVIVPAAHLFIDIAKAVRAVDIQVPQVGLADGLVDSVARRIAAKQTL